MAEEIEVEIDARGQVKFHVKGVKGKKCIDYVDIFQNVLNGKVKEKELTEEYYQASTDVVEEHKQAGHVVRKGS